MSDEDIDLLVETILNEIEQEKRIGTREHNFRGLERMMARPIPTKRGKTVSEILSGPADLFPPEYVELITYANHVAVCSCGRSEGCYYCYCGIKVSYAAARDHKKYIEAVKTIKELTKERDDYKANLPKPGKVKVDPDKIPVWDSDSKPSGPQQHAIYKDQTAGYWLRENKEWRRISRIGLPQTVSTSGPDDAEQATMNRLNSKVKGAKTAITAFEKKCRQP